MSAAFSLTYSSSTRTFQRRAGSPQCPQWRCQNLLDPLNRVQSGLYYSNRAPSRTHRRPDHIQLSAIPTSELDGGVFSTEDLVVGLVIGILLAFMASFLQGRRSQNDFVLWNKESEENTKLSSATTVESSTDKLQLEFVSNATAVSEPSIMNDNLPILESRSTVFDGDDWKEMSRPENYVFYKRNLNKKKESEDDPEQTDEQRWIVLALLVLFVPIFSVEFFFALSRQVLCGGGDNGLLSSLDASQYLCSPVR